jgi:L-threonylcarbamoyladenylate synthase
MNMSILKANIENIRKASEVIKSGGLVAFPTETVYGLGADGLNPVAAAKIFEAKNRPAFNPLILHINSVSMLRNVAYYSKGITEELIEKFWPGPLTLVLRKKVIVPEIITAGHETVAVRMPANETALKLIEFSGRPIAAPSANVFGKLSPTSAKHVHKQLKGKVDIILDGGKTNVGIESTIIEIEGNDFYLLRPGGLPVELIEKITGKLKVKEHSSTPNSPGQLKYHYSPAKPIRFLNEKNKALVTQNDAVLFFKKEDKEINCGIKRILCEKGDLKLAAAKLFETLHELEESGAEIIYVEKVPEEGLGKAIMDRLTKAANKYLGLV